MPEIHQWLRERARVNEFTTTPVPFAELDGWSFAADTGDLVHRSGGFFRIRGLHVTRASGPVTQWSQPIIDQPEIGVLGMLAKKIDGVLCLLVQAKIEPGNINMLQLSPTVQATRSNFLRLHGGATTRYLEYFTEPGRGRVLADVLHSEQGGSFYRKRNRNIIVETDEDVPVHDDYRSLSVGQIQALLREDNMVNMDARTVLSCLPLNAPHAAPADPAQQETTEIQSWLNDAKSRSSLTARPIRGRRPERGGSRGKALPPPSRSPGTRVVLAAVRHGSAMSGRRPRVGRLPPQGSASWRRRRLGLLAVPEGSVLHFLVGVAGAVFHFGEQVLPGGLVHGAGLCPSAGHVKTLGAQTLWALPFGGVSQCLEPRGGEATGRLRLVCRFVEQAVEYRSVPFPGLLGVLAFGRIGDAVQDAESAGVLRRLQREIYAGRVRRDGCKLPSCGVGLCHAQQGVCLGVHRHRAQGFCEHAIPDRQVIGTLGSPGRLVVACVHYVLVVKAGEHLMYVGGVAGQGGGKGHPQCGV
ncbi:NDP-hexose 2,3-dehydratase family protein [Streptomyces sp. NBC_00211]|uniref:NDP-hexose 2,3-dehydratase family protein n=1 Tax=Streptomyces sp. NBC_00211 TaxID=2975683 RepID=UPI002F91374A